MGSHRKTNTRTADGAVAFVAEVRQPSVFVFHDVEDALEEPTTLRAVKERVMEATAAQTLILTGATIEVPEELRGLALLWTLEAPTREEVERLVAETLEELRGRQLASVDLSEDRIRELEESLRGVSLPEAHRLILRSGARGRQARCG